MSTVFSQLGSGFNQGMGQGTGLWETPAKEGMIKTPKDGIQQAPTSTWGKVGQMLGSYGGNYVRQQSGGGVDMGAQFSGGKKKEKGSKSTLDLLEELAGRK